MDHKRLERALFYFLSIPKHAFPCLKVVQTNYGDDLDRIEVRVHENTLLYVIQYKEETNLIPKKEDLSDIISKKLDGTLFTVYVTSFYQMGLEF